MVNQFDRLDTLAREYQRYHSDKKITLALKIGKHFMAVEHVINDIPKKKVRFICWYLSKNGIQIKKSQTTESIYFFINGVSFRISDHRSRRSCNVMHNYVIKYDSCVVQVLYSIKINTIFV